MPIRECKKAVQGTCKSDFQDKTYGKNRRVHNENKPNQAGKNMVCVVCGEQVSTGDSPAKKKS